MRDINLAVWHCSADREGSYEGKDRDYYVRLHKKRGFRTVGYHILIFTDGHWEVGRKIYEVGAHAKGFNRNSIGIMYQGGLDKEGNAKDTRTAAQRSTMKQIKQMLDFIYQGIDHVGHRDLSVDLNGDGVISRNEWMKQCPCFDVKTEL